MVPVVKITLPQKHTGTVSSEHVCLVVSFNQRWRSKGEKDIFSTHELESKSSRAYAEQCVPVLAHSQYTNKHTHRGSMHAQAAPLYAALGWPSLYRARELSRLSSPAVLHEDLLEHQWPTSSRAKPSKLAKSKIARFGISKVFNIYEIVVFQ